jgi:hypothetical protein
MCLVGVMDAVEVDAVEVLPVLKLKLVVMLVITVLALMLMLMLMQEATRVIGM